MSGVPFHEAVSGQNGSMARAAVLISNQTTPFITLIGISGWLLASLVRTPLPGAGPALLVPSLGALIVLALALPLRRHILR
jgi:hypothetical protein